MAWNPSPKVAEARNYCQKFGKEMVIIVAINPNDGYFEVVSFGKTRDLCSRAEKVGRALEEALKDVWNLI